eukprot:scaffold24762_cov107-Isochrysis_galbana.AAC.2
MPALRALLPAHHAPCPVHGRPPQTHAHERGSEVHALRRVSARRPRRLLARAQPGVPAAQSPPAGPVEPAPGRCGHQGQRREHDRPAPGGLRQWRVLRHLEGRKDLVVVGVVL